jgi:hypothetical protein
MDGTLFYTLQIADALQSLTVTSVRSNQAATKGKLIFRNHNRFNNSSSPGILSPYSGPKSRPRKKPERSRQQKELKMEALLAACFILVSSLAFFDPEDGGNVPQKRQLNFTGLDDGISQKREFFTASAVCTSYPT